MKECPGCGREMELIKVETMTQYPDPKDNVVPDMCKDCSEAYYEHWSEMWSQYYGGLL